MDHPPVDVPDVEIILNNLDYAVKVPAKDYRIPSLGRHVFDLVTCCKPRQKALLHVLSSISTVLQPGTMNMVRPRLASHSFLLLRPHSIFSDPRSPGKWENITHEGC